MATQPATQEPAITVPKASIPFGEFGLEIKTFDDAWRYASCIFGSSMCPSSFKNVEDVVVAINMGARLGMAPEQSVQSIYVVNGHPAMWGDGLLAICQKSRVFDHGAFTETFEGEFPKDDFKAVCTVRRNTPGATVMRLEYSIADAKKAGLWGNAKKQPWVNHPKRMMSLRARAFALRNCYADLLQGFRQAEEAVDDIIGSLDLETQHVEKAPAKPRTTQLAERIRESKPEPVAEVESPVTGDGLFEGETAKAG